MIKKSVTFLFCISMLSFAIRNDDYIKIKQSLDKTEAYIGESIKYKIEIYSQKDVIYSFNGVEFQEEPEIMAVISTNKKIKSSSAIYEYTIAFYDNGNYTLPTFQIDYNHKGQMKNIKSEELSVSVISLSDGQTLPDIKKYAVIPYPFYVWLILLVGVIILIALIVLLIKGIKKKKEKAAINIYIPEDEEALTALNKLKKKQNEKYIDFTAYYFHLTEILRRYITRRFDLPILEMTTNEIKRYIKKEAIPDYDAIISFLIYSDLIKYAKQKPTLEILKQNTDLCEKYVLKNLYKQQEVVYAEHTRM